MEEHGSSMVVEAHVRCVSVNVGSQHLLDANIV
jgi:hypothetical protein